MGFFPQFQTKNSQSDQAYLVPKKLNSVSVELFINIVRLEQKSMVHHRKYPLFSL